MDATPDRPPRIAPLPRSEWGREEIDALAPMTPPPDSTYAKRRSERGGAGGVGALALMLRNPIGTGVETSTNQLYAAMAKNAGVDAPPEHAPARAGELERSSLDSSRAGIHLGWEPFTDLATGTGTVIDWFRDRDS